MLCVDFLIAQQHNTTVNCSRKLLNLSSNEWTWSHCFSISLIEKRGLIFSGGLSLKSIIIKDSSSALLFGLTLSNILYAFLWNIETVKPPISSPFRFHVQHFCCQFIPAHLVLTIKFRQPCFLYPSHHHCETKTKTWTELPVLLLKNTSAN